MIRLAADAKDLADRTEPVPVRLVARSAEPIDHWYWGLMVHDLAGMRRHKGRQVIDYCHDDDQILGWFEGHEVTERGLELTGQLTPVGDYARCRDVLDKMAAGVPYEASITFDEQALVVEYVDAGATAEANGRTYTGPIAVIRGWNLRGVAICPYGYDAATDSAALAQGATPASFRLSHAPDKEPPMIPDTTDNADADTTTDDTLSTPPADKKEEVKEQDAGVAGATDAETDDAPEGVNPPKGAAEFAAAFGDPEGFVYFGKGFSFEQAQAAHATKLKSERNALAKELTELKAAQPPAGGRPVQLSAAGAGQKSTGESKSTFRRRGSAA